jgi:hypothetical protein
MRFIYDALFVFSILALAFIAAFVWSAYTSPETIVHVVCSLRADDVQTYVDCRSKY